MIAIVDLGLGNVRSVSRALKYLNADSVITSAPKDIAACDKIVLPGVGSFHRASEKLHSSGMADALVDAVGREKKPLLGICLGMHLLADYGEEGGGAKGLGFIPGGVIRLRSEKQNLRLPHVGWNDLLPGTMRLFANIDRESCFYFVHSYEFVPADPALESARSSYGVDFVAAVKKDNIVGVQFHPEKSQKAGLQILKNFIEGAY